MNPSRQLLIGMLVLTLHTGLGPAQTPATDLPASSTGPAFVPAQANGPTDMVGPTIMCCPNCTTAVDRTGFIGGVGLYVIQPYFQNNPAYNVLLQSFRPGPTLTSPITTGQAVDRVNVSHSMAVAPLVWLGYINEDGFGGRARWWTFQQGTSQTATLPPFSGIFYPNPPIPGSNIFPQTGTQATITSATPLGLQAFGDTLSTMHGPEATSFNVTTELALQVADVEFLQNFRTSQCDFLLGGGLRIAQIKQTYNAYDAQSTSAAELRSLLSSYNFSGTGPTIVLEMRRALGTSGLALYSSARGSMVFGSAQQNASFGGQELRNEDPNPQFASQRRDRAIPIGELEAGVEYGRGVGNSWLFGQLALVGQEWFGAGNASRSTQFTPNNSPNPVPGGAALDSNIAFFGLSFRVGLNY